MLCEERYQEQLKFAEDGKENGGEDERKQIVNLALEMYEKIKFIDQSDRIVIIEIMRILSNHDNWI